MCELLFLAIDGLSYDLVRWYDCKFLSLLMRTNQHGVLLSSDQTGHNRYGEPLTGCAWNTIYTGLPASAHGLTADIFLRAGSVDVEIKEPSIWDILGKKFSLGLMTLPGYKRLKVALPPLNGWAINGFPAEGAVEARYRYPPDLEIPEWFRIEEYRANIEVKPDDIYERQRQQVEDKLTLLDHVPHHQIMAIGAQMIDFVSHYKVDRSAEYEFIDDWMSKVFQKLYPKKFMICSDHGFRQFTDRHSHEGIYIASLPGGYVPRTIFDIAPLTLFIMQRR